MKSAVNAALAAWALACVCLLATPSGANATTEVPAALHARNLPSETVFKGIASQMGRPVMLSQKARRYRVSGEFDLSDHTGVLRTLSASLGLIWYDDGQVVYVYDASELQSSVIQIDPAAFDDLQAFLQNASLYDSRYPLKHVPGSGTFYVSGPPKYVEIVSTTANLLHRETRRTTPLTSADGGQDVVTLVKLEHTFVSDRSVNLRGREMQIPGVASVLRELLSGAPQPPVVIETAEPVQGDGTNDDPMAPTAFMTDQSGPPPRAAPWMDASNGPDVHPQPASAAVRVVASPTQNSLLISGKAERVERIRQLVLLLDKPRRQIELSLWIIDVSKESADQLGINWQAGMRVGNVGFDVNVPAGKSLIDAGQTRRFLATVNALSQADKARVVSRPMLLMQDNVPAFFDNSRTFTIRLLGERFAQTQSVTYGTLIGVTPRVGNSDSSIEMVLEIEDGSTDKEQVDSLPVVGRTRISTIARVGRDQSLLIGGYTREEISDGAQKIPLLGDIPLVGGLFRSNTTRQHQMVRVFLVEPRLLERDASDLSTQSLGRRQDIQEALARLRSDMQGSYRDAPDMVDVSHVSNVGDVSEVSEVSEVGELSEVGAAATVPRGEAS